ncbi:uncharacterized protein LOC115243150 [Formica exsecta]|uniref:uncharacterized protein LOC115243150 n=1 Tax=Formica exsecta TaxID=72781 RepID=UPI00114424CE|nr:uncharacterized protein LOC115243150 [Formica exsecta]
MAKALTEDSANIEKLIDAENYQIWKFQIGIILRAHELFDIIDTETVENEKTNAWKKKNAQAQKIIATTVDKKPLLHIMNCKTAHEMWIKIATIYQRDNEQQKCSLLQTFYSMTHERNLDIMSYISKLKNINSNETERNGHEKPRYRRKEMRDKDRQSEEKAVAFKAINKKCYKCNKPGHMAKDCRTKNRPNEKEVRCFKCNKKGHMARSCDEKPKTERCSICKKSNHEKKDCYFRKKKEAKDERTEKVAFMAAGLHEDDIRI